MGGKIQNYLGSCYLWKNKKSKPATLSCLTFSANTGNIVNDSSADTWP